MRFRKKRPDDPPDYRVRGTGGGGFRLLLVLVLLIAASLAVARFRYHQTPAQLGQRIAHWVDDQFYPAPPPLTPPTVTPVSAAPAPATLPAPAPAPPPTLPTPTPDPLTWIIAHPEHWPTAVALRQDTVFPILAQGKPGGSGNLPAGSLLQIVEIDPPNVTLASPLYGGGRKSVPIDSTNLLERAAEAQKQAELAAFLPPAPAPIPAAPSPSQTHKESSALILTDDEDNSPSLGAHYQTQATIFRFLSEKANKVKLVLYGEATGDAGRSVQPMEPHENGLWELTVSQDLRGKFYAYLIEGPNFDSSREVLDPYAVNAVGSASRGRITPILSAATHGPAIESATDMVIYEMHVRDFTHADNSGVQNRGLYLGWTESGTHLSNDGAIKTGIDHLSELGVTHVQIMPVQNFDSENTHGSYNWGYMTSAFFSPEGMYATNPNDDSGVREFKALVDALHARGIGVIMDGVYNHTASHAPLAFIDPASYYRHQPDGSLANGAGCGNEVRSESPKTRQLILDSLKFWVRNYGIDGFRFDLMALIDRNTMRQAQRELHEINPHFVLYGEPWEPGATPLQDKSDKGTIAGLEPIGAFNDDFRNALKGPPEGSAPGWIQNGSNRDALKAAMLVSGWMASPAQSINYLSCHDNLVLWDKLKLSMPDANDPLLEDTMKLGYLVLFTSPGVPFLHGGEEFARTKGGNANSYDAPDDVNEVDWSLKSTHAALFNYTRDLIALRKAHSLFRLRRRDEVGERLVFQPTPSEKTLMFTLNGAGLSGETWKEACVLLNCDDSASADLALPSGSWMIALNENGSAATDNVISGKVRLRSKSGMVLFKAK